MQVGAIFIPDSEFKFEFVRSSGAGGQNVNKVNSKAILRWDVRNSPSLSEAVRMRFLSRWSRRMTANGELIINSSRYRDQTKNKQDTLDKLAHMISQVAIPPKKRKATKPTKASKERRLKEKKVRSQTKSLRKGFKMD